MVAQLQGPVVMDAQTFLAGAGGQVSVYGTAMKFPNLTQSEVMRWIPGAVYLRGFNFLTSGGIAFCISLNGMISADTIPTGFSPPGLIWKVSTAAGIVLFPGDGFVVSIADTVFISKNQASAPELVMFWSPKV